MSMFSFAIGRLGALAPMKKEEVWEEYTNQVDSVTDGFSGCITGI